MSGLAIPVDRTMRQPPRGYCLNPACLGRSSDSRFEFEVDHDRFSCPKCGNDRPPGVGLLVLTHLLVSDHRGPIDGITGRYRLACDERRAYLATLTNLEAATGEPSIANCPTCLAEAQRLGVLRQGASLEITRPHGV